MIPIKCKKCGGNNFAVKQNATDLYCTECGAWQKFATKDEIRLLSKEKAANEMFQELGYEKHFEDVDLLIYKNKFDPVKKITVGKFSKTIGRYKGCERVNLTYDEIIACAQLIKEMEANYE